MLLDPHLIATIENQTVVPDPSPNGDIINMAKTQVTGRVQGVNPAVYHKREIIKGKYYVWHPALDLHTSPKVPLFKKLLEEWGLKPHPKTHQICRLVKIEGFEYPEVPPEPTKRVGPPKKRSM